MPKKGAGYTLQIPREGEKTRRNIASKSQKPGRNLARIKQRFVIGVEGRSRSPKAAKSLARTAFAA
jgi:hypothetical protein